MPRILGIDVPNNKRIDVGLRSIYGIGPATAGHLDVSNSQPHPRRFGGWPSSDHKGNGRFTGGGRWGQFRSPSDVGYASYGERIWPTRGDVYRQSGQKQRRDERDGVPKIYEEWSYGLASRLVVQWKQTRWRGRVGGIRQHCVVDHPNSRDASTITIGEGIPGCHE